MGNERRGSGSTDRHDRDCLPRDYQGKQADQAFRAREYTQSDYKQFLTAVHALDLAGCIT